jgi:hypothetical protein
VKAESIGANATFVHVIVYFDKSAVNFLYVCTYSSGENSIVCVYSPEVSARIPIVQQFVSVVRLQSEEATTTIRTLVSLPRYHHLLLF